MADRKPRRIALDIFCGDWCGPCQFLEFVGVPNNTERQPHCRLFMKPLRRAARARLKADPLRRAEAKRKRAEYDRRYALKRKQKRVQGLAA